MNFLDMEMEIKKQVNIVDNLKKLETKVIEIGQSLKENKQAEKVFIIGCGDSYFAGLAVLPFLKKICGHTFEVTTAYQFSNYFSQELKNTTLVGISMSGNVARTLEAVYRTKELGNTVLGITNNVNGKLFGEADYNLFLNIDEEPGWTPSTLTFLSTLSSLYLLGIELSDCGEEEKSFYKHKLYNHLNYISEKFEYMEEISYKIAKNMHENYAKAPVYFIGGGPNYGIAKYGAAKFLEVCHETAIGQETEELAHQEFWILDKNNPVFLISPKGTGAYRSFEVGSCLREFGNDVVTITNDNQFEQLSKFTVEIPEETDELFSPLINAVPVQLIAYYYSQLKGLDPNRRTHVDPFRKKISRKLTRHSEVRI